MVLSMRRALVMAAMVGMSAGALMVESSEAQAFCGSFVAGGDTKLYNDATQVVLMRSGTRTVLSMQNNYKGPVKDFAMVVPVPVVLMEEQVKTLPTSLFEKLDQLSAPRLVEYWEQDPCYEPIYDSGGWADMSASPEQDMGSQGDPGMEPPPVVIEAEFEVGEYDVVVLSATEGMALESWLTRNNYTIPEGGSDVFQQYIQNGMYFFVAKIDPAKVTFNQGEAVLSPLRFAYDSPSFSLPIRLGMLNSDGEQDLIMYVLSQDGRYELANYPNAFIPTNKIVGTDTANSFGEYYSLLFEDTLSKNPGAVITEYAWDASTCDPCPGPTMEATDYVTLGADEFGSTSEISPLLRGWTLTRLHARYGADDIDEDLVFKKAPAVIGGTGIPNSAGEVDSDVDTRGYYDNFQGRYIMLHWWDGEMSCESPNRGSWGYGSPSGSAVSPNSGGMQAASGDKTLADFEPGEGSADGGWTVDDGDGSSQDGSGSSSEGGGEVGGGGGCTTGEGRDASGPLGLLLGAMTLGGLWFRRRRRSLDR